jgi:ABC-type multidrug transport system ATPase subunit
MKNNTLARPSVEAVEVGIFALKEFGILASAQAVLQAQDRRKSYGETRVVYGLSFTVLSGEVFGMLGPHVSGKTATAECIEGLRDLDSRSAVVALFPVASNLV